MHARASLCHQPWLLLVAMIELVLIKQGAAIFPSSFKLKWKMSTLKSTLVALRGSFMVDNSILEVKYSLFDEWRLLKSIDQNHSMLIFGKLIEEVSSLAIFRKKLQLTPLFYHY